MINVLHAKSVQSAAKRMRSVVNCDRGWSQSITWLGVPPDGGYSYAYDVSADGAVVVGGTNGRAFRWTASGGMQDLGTLGRNGSLAWGVSADGAVVVGGA
jgi:probable HAF family extracellular repeat protein